MWKFLSWLSKILPNCEANIFLCIGAVTFTILFLGLAVSLPNHNAFAKFDFGNGQTQLKSLVWTALADGSGFYDSVLHTYATYGTYHPTVTLTNNVSELALNLDIEVEQCVAGFTISFDKNGYTICKDFSAFWNFNWVRIIN